MPGVTRAFLYEEKEKLILTESRYTEANLEANTVNAWKTLIWKKKSVRDAWQSSEHVSAISVNYITPGKGTWAVT